MKNIIIAYPIKETAIQIKNVLESEGMYVSHICATGSSVLGITADMRDGVVVCASILRDISAGTLAEQLPAGFDIVALTKGGRESFLGNLISLPLPINRNELIETVMMLAASQSSYTNRSKSDADYISSAKALLMHNKKMTEMQAHKYLQSQSMKESRKMADIAKDIVLQYR